MIPSVFGYPEATVLAANKDIIFGTMYAWEFHKTAENLIIQRWLVLSVLLVDRRERDVFELWYNIY